MARFWVTGLLFALGAVGCMTFGAILLKGVKQAPIEVLPLQYGMGLLLCILFVPFAPMKFELTTNFLIPLAWLGILISVVATLLFY